MAPINQDWILQIGAIEKSPFIGSMGIYEAEVWILKAIDCKSKCQVQASSKIKIGFTDH